MVGTVPTLAMEDALWLVAAVMLGCLVAGYLAVVNLASWLFELWCDGVASELWLPGSRSLSCADSALFARSVEVGQVPEAM